MTFLRPLRVILELLTVVVAGLYASQNYISSDPQKVLAGFESQWLTSSAYLNANTLRDEGYIPLWQTWQGHGEPAIENPFSFTLNPLSTVPSLLFGAENGIKYSVVLYAVFVGIGGLVLGYVLKLGWLARLFLALTLVGRGNMHSDLSAGYYQLGVTQAYFPWVTAAALALFRFPARRWPPVLLAIILTLLFWGGNVYYTLPMLIVVAILTLVFAVTVEHRRLSIDWAHVRRAGLALALTAGLAAATLIPLTAHQGLIGGHPNEAPDALYESPAVAAVQFFTSQRFYMLNVWQENYFSFVLPLPLALLIFVFLPVVIPQLHVLAEPRLHRRVILGGLLLIALFFTWATRTNPLISWAYANLPLIGQWRVLARMLAVCSFWIGVLAAMRLDGLWRALVSGRRANQWLKPLLGTGAAYTHLALAALLIVAGTWAAKTLLDSWFLFGALDDKNPATEACVEWLRAENPNANLSVYGNDYWQIAAYVNQQVRFPHINADFSLSGLPPTLYPHDLRDNPPKYGRLSRDELYMLDDDDAGRSNPPEYLIPSSAVEREYWLEHGYGFVVGSPMTSDGALCLLRNPNPLAYAFSVPLDSLENAPFPLTPDATIPITSLRRQPGYVSLVVAATPDAALVVVAQELAWPGWTVTVDDSSRTIESVGGMIGVVLSPDAKIHRVRFAYDPPLFRLGAAITLATALACALYLLHAERILIRQRERRSRA